MLSLPNFTVSLRRVSQKQATKNLLKSKRSSIKTKCNFPLSSPLLSPTRLNKGTKVIGTNLTHRFFSISTKVRSTKDGDKKDLEVESDRIPWKHVTPPNEPLIVQDWFNCNSVIPQAVWPIVGMNCPVLPEDETAEWLIMIPNKTDWRSMDNPRTAQERLLEHVASKIAQESTKKTSEKSKSQSTKETKSTQENETNSELADENQTESELANETETKPETTTKTTKLKTDFKSKSLQDSIRDLLANAGTSTKSLKMVWALHTIEVPSNFVSLYPAIYETIPNQKSTRIVSQIRRAYLRDSLDLEIPSVALGLDKYSISLMSKPTKYDKEVDSIKKEETDASSSKPLPPCPARLMDVFHQIRSILVDVRKYEPQVEALLLTSNFEPANLIEASELLDSVIWLVNGTPDFQLCYLALLEEMNVLARARLTIKLLKNRFVADRLGFTSSERMIHQQDLLSNLSKLTSSEHKPVVDKYRKLAEDLPDTVKKEVLGIINRLNPSSPGLDFNSSRKLLDFVFELPWNKSSTDVFDMDKAKQILDSKHYGMEPVKARVIELLAVNQLTGSFAKGKILGLIGPPGTGKTTIAESIAESLGRKFGQISIGGLWDMSDLKGHRKSYLGAMAGMLMKTIHRCGTNNPVILLDEIDKLAPGSQVSTALLEILDPSQNHSFTDTWLDLPFDLSKVLFVCTANWEEGIHPALKDRLEVINLEGYLEEDKLQIAKLHLLPKCLKTAGLTQKQVDITDGALKSLIKHYNPMSPGVRDLETQLQSIVNQCSLEIARGNETSYHITIHNYEKLLNRDEFHKYEHETLPIRPGCASALTRTVQQIEAITYEPRGKHGSFHTTGKLDEVMEESASLAYTYVTNLIAGSTIAPNPEFFNQNSVHLHLPKGGQDKVGTHAGVSIAIALLSLALNKSVPASWAITGELTLLGKVLPVNQLQQKVHTARLHSIKHIVVPLANRPHWEELPASLKSGITVHYVSWFSDVVKAIWNIEIPNPCGTTANTSATPPKQSTSTQTSSKKKAKANA